MNWQPSAQLTVLHQRAGIIKQIRQFFDERNYLEVETPIMAQHGITDVYLSNIVAEFRNQPFYLQTSPEYHMKRLLAAGSGPVFQITKSFRDDELGRWHNPEFTMLEWYKLDCDHLELLTEVDALLQLILNTAPLIKKTYQEVFIESCRLDPFTASIDTLKQELKRHQLSNVLPEDETDRDQYLFLLMSHVIEPALKEYLAPVAIYNFPLSQAALARISHHTASRFEIYHQGVELANGFHELADYQMQQQRFESDLKIREKHKRFSGSVDHYLLSALKAGLPECSGVALGVDRLITLALNKTRLSEVLSFDFSRA